LNEISKGKPLNRTNAVYIVLDQNGDSLMSLPTIVSAKDLADLLGCSRCQVDRLSEDGVVVREDGGFALGASVRNFVAHRERVAQGATGDSAWQKARTLKTEEQAAEARLRRLQKEGELVEASEVERTWLAIVGVLRNRLLTIPSRMAARLARVNTPTEVQTLLRDEIYEHLTFIAQSTPGATKFGVRGEGNGGAGIADPATGAA
jgi:phage terminase Nu1 subunit (DNA packaging protein)